MSTDGEETRALRAYLAERDCPCPNCGYNLRGLAGERCPECNQALRLGVELGEPGVGRFLAVLLPLAIAGGAFAIGLSIIVVISGVENRWPVGRERPLLIFYPGLVAAALLTPAGWLIRRRGRAWLRGLSRDAARRVVFAAVLAGVAAPALWTLWILRRF